MNKIRLDLFTIALFLVLSLSSTNCRLFKNFIHEMNELGGEVCQNEICNKLAEELKIILDESVGPCNDFSSYVCGNFNKIRSIPPGLNSYDWSIEIKNTIKKELKELLANKELGGYNNPKMKAFMFYNSCLDMKSRNFKSVPTIRKVVKKLIEKSDYEENLAFLIKMGLQSRMITIQTKEDISNNSYNILFMDMPNLILSAVNLRNSQSRIVQKEINNYKIYMNKVLNILGLLNNVEIYIQDIIDFHIKIAKTLPSISNQNNLNFERLTIKDLESKCSEISWKKLITGIFSDTDKQFKDDDAIMVFSSDYIGSICSIIKEYKEDAAKEMILHIDLIWAAISSLVPLGSDNLILAEQSVNSALYEIQGKQELWETCIELTSTTLSDIMGNMYIKKSFPDIIKKDIELMIGKITDMLQSILMNNIFLDKKTKDITLSQLNNMKFKIGYPESLLSETKLAKDNENVSIKMQNFMETYIHIKQLSFKRMMQQIGKLKSNDHWKMQLFDINAYYNMNSNEIIFPASIFRYPLYDINLPVSYNYGAIGMVLGHEIIHGLNNIGSKSELLPQWWAGHNGNGKSCIINQYKKYRMNGKKLKPYQTNEEDIADNVGVQIAYITAFSKFETRKKLILNDLQFDEEQLFFVGQARALCSLFTNKAIKQRIEEDVHTIWKFRINGPLSNMKDFIKYFNCPYFSKMNNLDSCVNLL